MSGDDMTACAQSEIYEVFVQFHHLEHHQHVGSVHASSPDLALLMARENFLRRDRAVGVWVVPKSAITESASESDEFLASEFDRSYRRVDGYADNARRWKAFKQKALALEDIVHD